MRISDWSSDVCSSDLNSEYGAPGLDAYLGWLGAWRDMACAGEKHPVVDAAMAYLHEHRPRSAEVELLWGDSNPGNFLFFRDGRIGAAVDFDAGDRKSVV